MLYTPDRERRSTLDQRFYHSSQFAQKASVTVRTLRYYDKVGLLSPSLYTESGYRLYTNEDLLRLQNILALKFLGFSLEEIRALLQTGPKRLEEVLAQQKAMMEEKRAQLGTIIEAIEETELLLQTERCNWESIARVIQVIQMGQQNEHWSAKYFTPEQQKTMEELSRKSYTEEARQKLNTLHPNAWSEEDQKRVDEQYRFVKQELGRLVAQGANPASAEAQNVVQIKNELGLGFSQGDADVEASVGKWWEEFRALPENQKPFDMSIYVYKEEEQEFLNKALEIYTERRG
jgi:MerR family transcriptional regulator, thiopeptide resistance regulator